MLDILVDVVCHLLCVYQLRTGLLVSVPIVIVDFVQVVPLVIEMHAIATCSHAHFRYLVWICSSVLSALLFRMFTTLFV